MLKIQKGLNVLGQFQDQSNLESSFSHWLLERCTVIHGAKF